MLVGCGLLIVAAAVGFAWWQGLLNPEPEAATLEASVEALSSTTTDNNGQLDQSEAADTETKQTEPNDTETNDTAFDQASLIGGQLDGTWAVVPGDATFAGYRSDSPGGEVVGRSAGVTGQLTVVKDQITDVEIVVDMTQMKSDSSIRDDHLGSQGFEHRTYPNAVFVLRDPIALDQLPDEGEQLQFVANGDLTVRDATKSVSVELDGTIVADQLLVVGSMELNLEDFGAAISATSSATMEFSVVFESN